MVFLWIKIIFVKNLSFKISLIPHFYVMLFSLIIPVYNRPDEVDEPLEACPSLLITIFFEIVLIEDGSTLASKDVASKYGQT
jgi:glycosyltransferase involved in cell wall biosynthesis